MKTNSLFDLLPYNEGESVFIRPILRRSTEVQRYLRFYIVFILPLLYLICCIPAHSFAQNTGDFRTFASGTWNSTGTWERYNGTTWVNPAPSTPTNTDGDIAIRNGHQVTVSATITTDQVTVAAGGYLVINSGATMNVARGSVTDLTVDGTIDISGTLSVNTTGSTWISATAGSSSLINVLNGGTFRVGSRTVFSHNGTLTEAIGGDINVNGGASFTRGQLHINSGASVNISGTLDLSLGEMEIHPNGAVTVFGAGDMSAANNSVIMVDAGGLFSIAGTVTVGGGTPSTSNVILDGTVAITGNGNWDVREGVATTTTMNSGSTLIMGPNATMTDGSSGFARFTLGPGASMQIGAAAGINATAFTGNIQMRGLRTFSTSANYTYNGIATQLTGDGLPAAVNNLVIDNPGNTITFSNAGGTSVSGILVLSNGIIVSSASKMLSISNTSASAIIGNYNNTTYIDGPCKRNTMGTSEYLFPLGDGGYLKKAGVLPASVSASNFTLEAFNSAPGNRLNLGPGINYLSTVEEWEVTGTVASQIKLYWTAVSGVDENHLSDLLVAHYNLASSLWESKGNAAVDANLDYIISNSSNQYSKHTFAGNAYPLPVELLYFRVENAGNSNRLEWATASEINNDYFIIRKSINGLDYFELARVKGVGNSSFAQYYSAIDEHPFQGINYYRICQADYDETIECLATQAVGNRNKIGVFLAANPWNDNEPQLLYSGMKEAECEIKIMDVNGRKIHHARFMLQPGINSIDLENSLAKGIYLVAVDLSIGQSFYFKWMKAF